MPVIELTDESFERTLAESDLPVVVDFWAPWCGPCRIVAPVLERIAAEQEGRVLVAKLDVDQAPRAAAAAGVAGIPFIARFEGGRMVAHTVGAAPKARIEDALGLSPPPTAGP